MAGKDGHYDEAPRLFLRGRQIVRLDIIKGTREAFDVVDHEILYWYVSRAAFWYRVEGKGDKRKEVAARPDEKMVVRQMLAGPKAGRLLPRFEGFIGCPVFGADGRLHARAGYNGGSHLYLRPTVRVGEVPETPSEAEVREARDWLIGGEGALWDFKYTHRRADMAHALVAALQQFVRPIIQGPTPLFLIDKPNPGDGATTLAKAIAMVGTGDPLPPGSVDLGSGGEEFRKRITAEFRKNPQVILFDNIGKPLKSDLLAVALTEPVWSDRILGGSNTLDMPIRVLWLGTGKNPEMNEQIRRRTIRIRLDPMGVKLQDREFVHPEFEGWVEDHLDRLVWAGLVLCQNWVRRGMPPGEKRHNSYPKWSRVMGGILEAAGIEGFLENLETMHNCLDENSEAMHRFVLAWWEQWKGKPVFARDLSQLYEKIDADLDIDPKLTQARAISKLLRETKHTHFGGLRVEKGPSISHTDTWRLSRMEGVDADALNEVLELSSRQEGQEAREDETQGGWEASK